MFDPETYEPFDDWGDRREVHQRINNAMRWGVVDGNRNHPPLVADFAEIDAMADAMAATTFFGRISYLDTDREAQGLALDVIDRYRAYVEDLGETLIGEHGGTQYDGATMNRAYALLAFEPKVIFPLSLAWGWQDVAARYLSHYNDCDVAKDVECTQANDVLAIKSGEFICIFKCCGPCRAWFDDDGQRVFEPARDWHRR